MVKYVIFLLAVTTAIDIQQQQEFNGTSTEESDIKSFSYNSSVAKSFFNSGILDSALKVIEDILFLKEVKACRPNYPNMDTSTFYKHLYCYLVESENATETESFCQMTDDLVKKIRNRVSDFVMFKNLFDTSVDCEQWYLPTTRSLRDSDELVNGGIKPEILKVPEVGNIYLGPSVYPVQTIEIRKDVMPRTLTSSRTTAPPTTEHTSTVPTTKKEESEDSTKDTTKTTSGAETEKTNNPEDVPMEKGDKSNDLPIFKEPKQTE